MQSQNRRIIRSNTELRNSYHDLVAGDIVVGRLRLKPSEECILLDLLDRGVHLIPSALSQLACRSKTFQVRLFTEHMIPRTMDIHDIHDLLAVMMLYARHGIDRGISKLDRKNAGQGVLLWDNIEALYSQAILGAIPFPFVMQPFLPECCDIRVVILDTYAEAYRRWNPYNFRKNLHFGGKSEKTQLTEEQYALCRKIMRRGKFPYAHIDLLVKETGETYFSEINLRGGIKGAAISGGEYKTRIETIHARLVAEAVEKR